MARRTTKFACAILLGLIGSPLLTLLPRLSAVAADDCLTEPTGEKPDGQHWRYRSERGRRCWYLKDATGNAALRQQSSSQPPSAWDFAQPAPPRLTARRADSSASRSDDTTKPQPANTGSVLRTRPAPATFDVKLQRDMPAAPWQPPQTQFLDSADIDTASTPAPTGTDEPAPDARSTATTTIPADAGATGTPRPAKPVAPIHKLLMVVIGALSLSGLLASAMYRLSKAGSRRRRDRNWQRAMARLRRNRERPRSKQGIVHARSRTDRAGPQPVVVAAPPVRVPPPALPVEPAIKATDDLAAVSLTPASAAQPSSPRPAKAAPRPAPTAAFHPVDVAPAAETAAPAPSVDPAAELVDLLGSHAAKLAIKQSAQVPPPANDPNPEPPAVAPPPPRLPKIADPEAELANLLESRFAPPPAPPTNATRRKPQQPAQIGTAATKPVDPITELTNLLEAKENMRAVRLANAAGRTNRAAPPEPTSAQAADPAAELFDRLEARAAEAASGRGQAPRPGSAPTPDPGPTSETAREMRPAEPAPAIRPEPALVRPATKPGQPPARAAKPIKAAARRKTASSAERTDMAAVKPIKAAAVPVERAAPVERMAATKPGKPTGKAGPRGPRRKDADMRPLPPSLMLEPENDGPSPPLDFIPRPRALRPAVRDVRQDESLDGVQDILARLSRHG